jgi:hypothetical protein
MILRGPERNTFETLYALDSFGSYWVENERLIQLAADSAANSHMPTWTPQTEEEIGEFRMELQVARHLHDEIMTPMFRYSCIVTLYTIAERELRRLVENLETERGQQKLKVKDIRASSFLAQTAKFSEVFFGLLLASCPQYQALCDLQKIRDCIVHCRGEVDLVNERDRDYLLRLKDRRAGFFAWERTDIDVEARCIEQFVKETWAFFIWVFAKLNWKIDDSWKNSKWATQLPPAGAQQSAPQTC